MFTLRLSFDPLTHDTAGAPVLSKETLDLLCLKNPAGVIYGSAYLFASLIITL